MNTSAPTSYSCVSRLLHWSMALLMIGMLISGLSLDVIPKDIKFPVIMTHKSIGVIILIMAFARLAWKFLTPQPAPSASLTPSQAALADLMHYTLYALMIAMPISGWYMSSTAGYPTGVFGLFELPMVAEKNHDLHEAWENVHGIYGNLIIALVLVHVGAALQHHFIKKDDVMRRMLPCRKSCPMTSKQS